VSLHVSATGSSLGAGMRKPRHVQKVERFGRRRLTQVLFAKRATEGVVLLLRRTVRVAAPREAPQIAIELGADMPELVDHGVELLGERLIEKPRQVEPQDVQHLAAVAIEQSLHRVAAASAPRVEDSSLETQRRERGLQAVPHRFTRLAEGDRHAVDVDVP
jgi:hypothetical protein